MTLTTRRTLFSILILMGLGAVFLTDAVFHTASLWGSLAFCLVLAMGTGLWMKGLHDAGQGWRRALFLTAFAAPIVWIGLEMSGGAHDAYDGFLEGYSAGSELATQSRSEKGEPPKPKVPAPPNPFPVMSPWIQLASWVIFTTIFAKVLDLMERRAAEAEHQGELAREARYQALGARLAPHFIFNTLNTLHAQIESDQKGAQATTERLAELFRQVIASVAQPVIPLGRELAFVEAYLGIEQARFGSRLRVSLEVPEALEAVPIPPLSLQLLVENAIKHGVTPLEKGGEVRIGAHLQDGALHLWVEDPGTGASLNRGTGTALETLRQRLEKPEDLEMGMVGGRHRVAFRWRQA